jgi:hypothetical protein
LVDEEGDGWSRMGGVADDRESRKGDDGLRGIVRGGEGKMC